jgi:hypothetical protein
MNIRSSFFTLTCVSLVFVGLLVLGMPVSGLAGTPHVCSNDGTTHMTDLPGVDSFTFVFFKNCADTSSTVQWQFAIYDNTTSNLIPGCQWGPFKLPPTDTTTYSPPLTCNGLPHGNPGVQVIKVVISYRVSLLGGWMNHTDMLTNNP